ATLGDERACTVVIEIGDEFAAVGVGDRRAHRHAQHHVLSAATVAVGAVAVLAALRAMDARVAVIDERVDVAVGLGVDAAAATAIAAVGTAAGDILFSPERRDAIAAVAGDRLDRRLVDEFHARDSFT